jgi:molecular chaperone GrpE
VEEKNDKPQEPAVERPAEDSLPQAGSEAGKATEPGRQLEQAQRERDEFLDLLRRSRADFSNYRKRVEREQQELMQRATGDFAKALLPVLDDLDRAFDAMESTQDVQAFVEGIRLVSGKLKSVLSEVGITAVDPEHEPFDPVHHEAVMVEEHDELEPGTVSEVLRKGYVMKGKPLRAAQVKVVKAPETSGDAEPETTKDRKDEEK